jgi:excisionase family DNA binding protein
MEIMTLKKAAAYLGLSTDVLRRKANDGSVPAAKLGTGSRAPWRFYREELDQMLHSNGAPVNAELEEKQILKENVVAYYNAEDEETKIAALQKISNQKDTQAIPFLCEILLNKDNQPSIMIWSIKAMANILGKEADCYLIGFSDHEDIWIRLEIASFFARYYHDAKAIQVLNDYYEDSHSFVVLKTLLEIDPQKYQHELKPMLTGDGDPHTKVLALRELRKIEYHGITALLKPLFKDKDNRLKSLVINITGEKKLKTLIPELQNIINSDTTKTLKKEAAIALTQIFSTDE